ncbi:hypothetical protein LOTGIDRAFT_159183 [Lottia gigantea]|uniref:CUB domain-containing protein n=1 Tax=Lottia gigantea TaxID=225164 RepID=V4A3G8_LOTGI|nr:hypothetical protein LOTGIDRAFT_159183 [Lottia gigantea]ESO98378.1 hypothetical protein LOTGIDRAFT_159183 [Lottia gigantea]
MILPFLLFSFCIYQTHEQQIVLTNTILCGEIPDNAQFQTNQSDKNTASFNQSDISTESLDQSKISTVSFNQSESPTIQTSQSTISTDLNTDSKNHNSQTNTRPNGTIEVSIGTFKTHYLITGLFYEVTITSSSGSGLITGLFIVTNQTRYEQGIHCPLNLSDISFPFTFLWQPDIGVKPVEIRCTLVYNNDVQFDLSTVLYPPTGCVKYFTDLYGEVSSPNFPAHYPSNLNCTYIIVVDKSYKLHLQIQKLNLEKTNNMCLDYITLNYDNNTTDRLCDYTDLEYKSYDSNTNWVVIEFYSDNSITNTGFQIDYTAQQLQGMVGVD